MPSADSVQVLPGKVVIRTVDVGTGWAPLPKVDHCLSVLVKPRAANTAAIYISDQTGASDANRGELAATDPGITYDIDNPNQLFVASVSGTQKLELHIILRGR